MSVYYLDELQKFNEKITNSKLQGLIQLYNLKTIPIPAAIFINEDEYRYYKKFKKMSPNAVCKIKEFVNWIDSIHYIPLFSIRCEAKSVYQDVRPPKSLLNVGIRSVSKERLLCYNYGIQNIDIFYKTLIDTFAKRVSMFNSGYIFETSNTVCEELIFWIKEIYQLMLKDNKQYSHELIVQRMVFGCIDEYSGEGICCNYPNNQYADFRFKGIFLPNQQDGGNYIGGWGPGEMDLSKLVEINPKAYFELRGIFDYLESKFGPNRYLEFTLQGEDVFILQHETRERLVKCK